MEWPNQAGNSFLRNGYRVIRFKDGSQKYEHVLVAEKALGKPLPEGAEVHHWNEVRTDNRRENLLICPNVGYHNTIHRRMRAKEVSGDANKKLCVYCKQYDDAGNLKIYKTGNRETVMHAACVNRVTLQKYHSRKGH